MSVPRLLVVGGNGYLGSAVCKAAVSRGWEVASMSSSGKAYTTPAGHTPKWVHRVKWHRASAFEPASYADLVASSSAVVHTLGILLEDGGYKQAVRDGDVFGIAKALAMGLTGSGAASNPLKTKDEQRATYESMNRDSAVTVLKTMLATPPTPAAAEAEAEAGPSSTSRSFTYVSAAGSILPGVPQRYVQSKREAEAAILDRCTPTSGVHPIIVRPGLMYHAHLRPLSTLPAFALSCTAHLHDSCGGQRPAFIPKGGVVDRAADNFATHPLHVDHVADAIVKCIAEDKAGVFDVQTMRRWAGFDVPSQTGEAQPVHA